MRLLTREEAVALCKEFWDKVSFLYDDPDPEIILYGSYARGDAEEGSDLDVMILVDEPRESLAKKRWEMGGVAADLGLDHDLLISPIVENKAFFRYWLPAMLFFQNIDREGVRIRGSV